MNVVGEFARRLVDFLGAHEALVGRVALASSRVEREVNKLFGYVFDLDFESLSIITRNIPNVSRKISALRQGLVQEGCKISGAEKQRLERALASVGEFISLRNDLVHGSIFPDFERLNTELDRLNQGKIDESALFAQLDETMMETLVVPRFEPKTGELKYIKYSISQVERQINAANAFVLSVSEVLESLKSQFDWIAIAMPRSELRKLSR